MRISLIGVLIVTFVACSRACGDDLDVLRDRLICLYTGQIAPGGTTHAAAIERLDERVTELMARSPKAPQPGGGGRLGMQTVRWYSNILRMAQAYTAPAGSLFGSAPLKAAIESRLRDGLPVIAPDAERSGDWYLWEIGTPRELGPALLLLDGKIDPALFADTLTALRALQSPKLTLNGSNLAQEGRNQIYVGLLRRDVGLIDHVYEFLNLEMTVHNDSGILEDYSYQFHGRLVHASGYGTEHARALAEAIYISEPTRWRIDDQRKALLANHLAEHIRWVLIDGSYDLSVRGRGTRYNFQGDDHLAAMCLLAAVDSPRREQLRAATAELIGRYPRRHGLPIAGLIDELGATEVDPLTGFRHFYVSDFTVFRQADFYTSVRMYSSRLIDYEGAWGANLAGWNLCNGLTYITRTGDEYWRDPATVRKHLDWDRLPGTTSRIGVHPARGYNVGTSPFAGGAGSETAGICGFVLIPAAGDFTANKSYFFFKDGFIAMGSGIRSTADHAEPINTTVTQWACEQNDTPLVLSGGRTIRAAEGTARWDGVRWAFCDNVGYVFFKPVTLGGHRRGKLVTLWLDHGPGPADATYAYAVLPASTLEQTKRFASHPTVRIVAHTTTLHACHNASTGALGAIFWRGGSMDRLAVDRPAVLYIEPQAPGHLLAVQNPLHTAETVRVRIAPTVGAPEADLEIPTVAGRVYRLGLGGATVTQPPREDQVAYKSFSVTAHRGGENIVLTVHIPEPAIRDGYRFMLRGSKGHYRRDFTDADIIDRPAPGVVRYRWRPDPNKLWRKQYRAVLNSGMHLTVHYFSVPDPPGETQ